MVTRKNRTRKERPRDWRPAFLKHFAKTGNILMAAEKAKVGRTTAYKEIAEDSEFAALVDDAREEALDVLERELFRRGVTGIPVPKSIGGVREIVTEYSDTLLLAQLNAHGKKRGYTRDSRVQLSGEVAQKHTVVVTTDKRRTYGGKSGQRNGATEEKPVTH